MRRWSQQHVFVCAIIALIINPNDTHAVDVLDTELSSLASQTDASRFLSNPATLHAGSDRYQYHLNTATGIYFNNKQQLLDDFDDAEDEGDRLQALSQERLLLPSDFERQIALFERMDGKLFTLAGGNVTAISLPFEGIETTLVASVVSRLATSFDYQEEDATTLRTAPLLGIIATPDLKSRIVIHGITVSDIGINMSQELQHFGGIRLGLTLKYQGVRLLERATEIDDYEEITLDEFKRGLKTVHNLNADVGIYKAWRLWHSSLTIKSLNSKTYTGPHGSKYRQNPGVIFGLGYRGEHVIGALDWDVVPSQRRFGLLDDEQRIRLSSQYRLNHRWHLSAGVGFIIEGRDNDALSMGAGYHWESGAAINGAFIYSGPDEMGGAIQIRFPFWKKAKYR
ncbi:MAG: hypothetical protein ACI9G5_002078 [Paracoccaceae bacterium]|jgi:hypothetical protein